MSILKKDHSNIGDTLKTKEAKPIPKKDSDLAFYLENNYVPHYYVLDKIVFIWEEWACDQGKYPQSRLWPVNIRFVPKFGPRCIFKLIKKIQMEKFEKSAEKIGFLGFFL